RSELSQDAWRDSTAASPAATGKYSWVWVMLSRAPWYSPDPVFSNAAAVSRKVWKFGWVSASWSSRGDGRIGTARGLSASSSRFWTTFTWAASSSMISWRSVAVSPPTFLGDPAAARGADSRPRAGTARAEAPSARARNDRRERARSGTPTGVVFVV